MTDDSRELARVSSRVSIERTASGKLDTKLTRVLEDEHAAIVDLINHAVEEFNYLERQLGRE